MLSWNNANHAICRNKFLAFINIKHIRELFFNKLYKFFSISSPFVLVTFNNTLTMWYCYHELFYTSPRTFLFSLSATRRFEILAPFSPCSRKKCFCMECWIAFVDPRSTIKVEWYNFCSEICGQFLPLISKQTLTWQWDLQEKVTLFFLHWK